MIPFLNLWQTQFNSNIDINASFRISLPHSPLLKEHHTWYNRQHRCERMCQSRSETISYHNPDKGARSSMDHRPCTLALPTFVFVFRWVGTELATFLRVISHRGGNLGEITFADHVAQLLHQLSFPPSTSLNLPQNEHLMLILPAHNPYTAIPVNCTPVHGPFSHDPHGRVGF